MTLIALRDGHEVARIHGPHRNEFVLEYHEPNSETKHRIARSNLHVLRGIAERYYPDLEWTEAHGPPVAAAHEGETTA